MQNMHFLLFLYSSGDRRRRVRQPLRCGLHRLPGVGLRPHRLPDHHAHPHQLGNHRPAWPGNQNRSNTLTSRLILTCFILRDACFHISICSNRLPSPSKLWIIQHEKSDAGSICMHHHQHRHPTTTNIKILLPFHFILRSCVRDAAKRSTRKMHTLCGLCSWPRSREPPTRTSKICLPCFDAGMNYEGVAA